MRPSQAPGTRVWVWHREGCASACWHRCDGDAAGQTGGGPAAPPLPASLLPHVLFRNLPDTLFPRITACKLGPVDHTSLPTRKPSAVRIQNQTKNYLFNELSSLAINS